MHECSLASPMWQLTGQRPIAAPADARKRRSPAFVASSWPCMRTASQSSHLARSSLTPHSCLAAHAFPCQWHAFNATRTSADSAHVDILPLQEGLPPAFAGGHRCVCDVQPEECPSGRDCHLLHHIRSSSAGAAGHPLRRGPDLADLCGICLCALLRQASGCPAESSA
jgi:hypothetical protein